MESGDLGSDPTPRKMVLTSADLKAVASEFRILISEHAPAPVVHVCPFSPEEAQTVRDFVSIYKETRSTLLKLAIGAFFFLMLVLVVLGVKGGYISPGGK